MKSVVDIVLRFSARLMLVVIVALALPASGASAHGHGGTGYCPNESRLARSSDRAGDVSTFEKAGIGQVQKAHCTSACCNAACSMAVLALPATVPSPVSASGIRHAAAFRDAEGIDPDGLSRPPRPSPAVKHGTG